MLLCIFVKYFLYHGLDFYCCSGQDQLLPSREEGERLRKMLSKCEIRTFNDSGHALFLVC